MYALEFFFILYYVTRRTRYNISRGTRVYRRHAAVFRRSFVRSAIVIYYRYISLCCCSVPPRRGPCAIEYNIMYEQNTARRHVITSNDIISQYEYAVAIKYHVYNIIMSIILSAQFYYYYLQRVNCRACAKEQGAVL